MNLAVLRNKFIHNQSESAFWIYNVADSEILYYMNSVSGGVSNKFSKNKLSLFEFRVPKSQQFKVSHILRERKMVEVIGDEEIGKMLAPIEDGA